MRSLYQINRNASPFLRYVEYVENVDPLRRDVLLHDISKDQKVCRHIYNNIVKRLSITMPIKAKWNEILHVDINESQWTTIFTLPKYTTQDLQIRTFQYKIIHRILPSNKLLYVYQIKETPFCDHCGIIPEDLIHLFHQCPRISDIWHSLANWLYPNLNIFPYINSECILLGIYNECKPMENIILLLVKRYIFVCKCNNKDITLRGLLFYLKSQKEIYLNSLNEKRQIENKSYWSAINHLFINF